jgi:putative ABC transport system permease protein
MHCAMQESPDSRATAVLALAFGIGANTAIFSMVNAVLLQSLPYPQSDRLVMLCEQDRKGEENFFPPADVRYWRDQNRSFDRATTRWESIFSSATGGTR